MAGVLITKHDQEECMRNIYATYFIDVVLKPVPMIFQLLRSRKFQGKILITSGVMNICMYSSR